VDAIKPEMGQMVSLLLAYATLWVWKHHREGEEFIMK
jgi:hypothetical protein